MRVTTTRKITFSEGIMLEIDTYEITGLSLLGGLVSPSFHSLISLEDIYEQIVNGGGNIWVRGHREFQDNYGNNIGEPEDYEPLDSEVMSVEVFG